MMRLKKNIMKINKVEGRERSILKKSASLFKRLERRKEIESKLLKITPKEERYEVRERIQKYLFLREIIKKS